MSRFDCQECGMNVAPSEYHPYWYCVLFKNGVDPRTEVEPIEPAPLDVKRLAQAMETVLAPTLRKAGVKWSEGSTSAAAQVAAEYRRSGAVSA